MNTSYDTRDEEEHVMVSSMLCYVPVLASCETKRGTCDPGASTFRCNGNWRFVCLFIHSRFELSFSLLFIYSFRFGSFP